MPATLFFQSKRKIQLQESSKHCVFNSIDKKSCGKTYNFHVRCSMQFSWHIFFFLALSFWKNNYSFITSCICTHCQAYTSISCSSFNYSSTFWNKFLNPYFKWLLISNVLYVFYFLKFFFLLGTRVPKIKAVFTVRERLYLWQVWM